MPVQQALGDTIVALATPAGEGALAVVRVSGNLARHIETYLTGRDAVRASHRLRRVTLRAPEGNILDEAMAVQMHAPNSFTGEDVLELHLHGGRSVVQAVLAACLRAGARSAAPGEFTFRAFLHGKLDLAQAEAVGDLIAASSDAERTAATRLLQGGLSEEVQGLLGRLQAILAQWQAALDFPEYPTGDGLSPEDPQALQKVLTDLNHLQARTVQMQSSGGRRVVLAGPPNAGKSTLLNALVGEERALVDAQPGTTRDPVEATVPHSSGPAWTVVDTAGIRAANPTQLEGRGINLSRRWAQRADLLCWVMPVGSTEWPAESFTDAHVVGSKADLVAEGDRVVWEREVIARGWPMVGCVAAQQGRGVSSLRRTLEAHLRAGLPAGAYAVRARHAEALAQAAQALQAGLQALGAGMTLDAVSVDVRQAAHALGSILGRSVDAAVLDQIFTQFCIGK